MSNAVQKDISRAKRQAANILIFIDQRYNPNEITRGIYNAIKFDKNEGVQMIGILFQKGNLVMMTRAEVLDESFRQKFAD